MSHSGPFRSVLIFGGAGFIGSNWAHYLLRNTDAQVHVFDNLSRQGVVHNLADLRKAARGTGRLKITLGDVRERAAVSRAVATATDIFNFAAQVAVTTSIDDPRLDFEVNLGGTFNILEAARQSGNRPFLLFTSTNKVYGDMGDVPLSSTRLRHQYAGMRGISEERPLDFHSPYGCSKGAADQYVHDYARIYNLPTVVFRMSCIAGPRQFGNEDQGWVAHFLYSALQDSPLLIYGDGRQVRDVLCVDDLMRAFQAVRMNVERTAGEIYNVGGGFENTVSLLELMGEIKKFTGREVRHRFCPMRPGDQLVYVTDYSKLQKHTGWRPQISVGQTLETIHDWWLKNRDLFLPEAPVEPAAAGLQEVREAA
jgi:CDP-paratose 2-epimerase